MPTKKNIKTPERFWELFVEFRKWKFEQKVSTPVVSKFGVVVSLEHTPPLTWAAFDAWLYEHRHIKHTEDYRSNKDDRYKEYAGVIHAITQIMFANKFEGAAVGVFNANLIARELGITDKKEIDLSTLGKSLAPQIILPPDVG